MIFATIALTMLLVAIAAVAVPLWRGIKHGTPVETDPAEGTHALQCEELRRDLASGLLAESDYRAALRDIELERHRVAVRQNTRFGSSRRAAVLAGLFIAVAAALLYGYYGDWRTGAEGVEQASVPAVEQMVADLSARLHSTDGANLQGWVMLGHAYVIMQRYPDAVDAYSHAYKLAGNDNSDVLAGYAEALTLANPSDFMDKSLPLFEQVLKLDPQNAKALWYGGLGAFERGDKPLAIQRWRALLAQDPPPQYRTIIDEYIVKAGGSVTAAQVVATSGTVLRVHVSLAPSLRAKVRPEETLFVFALPEGAVDGPPLAVRRFVAGELPLELSLSDQDAPIPGRTLSGQAAIQIIARISSSGSPEPQPGDLIGRANWDRSSNNITNITIDTVMK